MSVREVIYIFVSVGAVCYTFTPFSDLRSPSFSLGLKLNVRVRCVEEVLRTNEMWFKTPFIYIERVKESLVTVDKVAAFLCVWIPITPCNEIGGFAGNPQTFPTWSLWIYSQHGICLLSSFLMLFFDCTDYFLYLWSLHESVHRFFLL